MKKLVIANRGEIARRILRTARERGYLVSVISTPDDAGALVRGEADDVLEVSSFLDIDAIVEAASSWRASALHPGYGFLSESSEFARRVESADVSFVGPSAESMEQLGNKERAKELAKAHDVPTLQAATPDEVDELAERGIEPPYLVKAAGGGGGRGMRVVENAADLKSALARASEEAKAGFGDPTVFVERYVAKPRHIEIQVVGDGKGGGVALGERECSMQRRYQKVIEEAPSPVVAGALRQKMCAAAMKLVAATGYRGAGTVEFLLDREGNFYFLEVNTRLQVEHPVTEAIFGVDLVAAQLDIAEGRWPQSLEQLEPRGWAIEARVLAEDPRADFLPTPGRIVRYREPQGAGVRVDSGVREGDVVQGQFDSMIAKVIAVGDTRAHAVACLAEALASFVVHGPVTNLPFLQAVIQHPDFRDATFSTAWIGKHLDELNRSLLPGAVDGRLRTVGFREQLSLALRGGVSSSPAARRFRNIGSEGAMVGSGRERRALELDVDDETGAVVISGPELDGPIEGVATALDSRSIALTVCGDTLHLEDPRASSHRVARRSPSDGEVRAPMAGKILEIHVAEGARVEQGELLIVVESMKMQLEVTAPVAGKVERIDVEQGQVLDGPEIVVMLTP